VGALAQSIRECHGGHSFSSSICLTNRRTS
jgi:hypothetical protein